MKNYFKVPVEDRAWFKDQRMMVGTKGRYQIVKVDTRSKPVPDPPAVDEPLPRPSGAGTQAFSHVYDEGNLLLDN